MDVRQIVVNVSSRTDEYGGSIENRARFMFEVLEAILSEVDSSKVGIRVSPFSGVYACTDDTPTETFTYVIKKLDTYNLSFLHLVEPRAFHQPPGKDVPAEGVTRFFRPMYRGPIFTASGYDRKEAIQVVDEGIADAVAFGRAFIGNPDYVKRLKLDAPLNEWDRRTAYWTEGVDNAIGYTDYPFLDEAAVDEKNDAAL